MELICKKCLKIFKRCIAHAARFKNHFCSKKCFGEFTKINHAKIYINCAFCNKKIRTFNCYLKRSKHKFCSKKCSSGFKNYNNTLKKWKGGCVSKSTGYKYIRLNGKQIEEHRLVMIRHLKRKLKTSEFVHHINNNKLDNRIENLEIIDNSQHSIYHAKKREKIIKCKKCNTLCKQHARNLCHNCYYHCLRHNLLNNYELSYKKK